MIKNDVSFILSFVILMAKMWIFRFSPGVCPTESSNLVFSPKCLVSNKRLALLGDIRLGGSATKLLVPLVHVVVILVLVLMLVPYSCLARET